MAFLTGGPDSVARAQGFFYDSRPDPYREEAPRPARRYRADPYGSPAPQPYGGGRGNQPGYGGRPSANYAPAPPPSEFRWPWEQAPQPVAPPPSYDPGYSRRRAPSPAYGEEPVRRAPSPSYGEEPVRRAPSPSYADEQLRRRRPPRPAPVIAREPAIKPKTSTASIVAVFGDSVADVVAQGLDEAFEDNREMAVLRKTRGESGLARNEDWPKTVQDFLKANPKVAYAVVLLGTNDSQPIKDGDQTVEPLSDRWREIYRDRVDALIKAIGEKNIPLVWIGVPPVRNERLSNDLIALNDIYRDRVQRAGGTYVDIWPGFVDGKNRYATMGPDVEGQTARLRTNDGVSFTRAGGRKVAHFANVEIKRIIEAKRSPPEPAVAGRETDAPATATRDPADLDRVISASLPTLPEPPGLPSLPQRPVAGPVMPLTRTEVAPGATLVAGKPRLEGDAGVIAERALRSGIAPAPQPGRADDFKWPASERAEKEPAVQSR